MSPNERIAMNTRRQAFMLAGALTATVFTAMAAFAGVTHRSASASKPAGTPVVQVAQQPVRAPEWGDD
jgi:hypothetical protein